MGNSPERNRRLREEKSDLWRERRRAASRRRSQRNLKICRDAKSVPCFDCKVGYPYYVMDFDHRDPSTKLFTIGTKVMAVGLAVLLAEIAKCDVVCANCHRMRQYRKDVV